MGALDSLISHSSYYYFFGYFFSAFMCGVWIHGARSHVPEKKRHLNGNMCFLSNTCRLWLFHADGAVTHLDVSPTGEQQRPSPPSPRSSQVLVLHEASWMTPVVLDCLQVTRSETRANNRTFSSSRLVIQKEFSLEEPRPLALPGDVYPPLKRS